MAANNGYPKRDSHFAHRQLRLMTKVCAAQDIGPEAVLLVTMIAHLEDAKRYKGPVTFFNGQLMPILGISSVDRLNRIRAKAVEAGWLEYRAGGKGKPGVYWGLIPDHMNDLPDTSVDESADDFQSQNTTGKARPKDRDTGSFPSQNTTAIRGETGRKEDLQSQNTTLSRGQTEGKQNVNAEHSTLTLDPSPFPKEEDPPLPPKGGEGPDELLRLEAELIAAWNATPGVVRYGRAELFEIRRREFHIRIRDPSWDWRAALAKFPLQVTRGRPDGWKPTIEFFLREESVPSILEGKYDFTVSGKQNAPRTGPGQRHEPAGSDKPARRF